MVKRVPRRARERGAAVFVVVMAITLLTAVGLFAAHSATLVDQASGHARLARQTQYIAEYGTLTATAELSTAAAPAYIKKIEEGADRCHANDGLSHVPTRPACHKLDLHDLNLRTVLLTNTSLIEATASNGTPGSFGANANTSGDFVVELTDIGDLNQPIAGTDIGDSAKSLKYRKVVASTTGQVRSSAAACVDSITTTVGRQAMRARLLIGPAH
jgi:hypothetical protein